MKKPNWSLDNPADLGILLLMLVGGLVLLGTFVIGPLMTFMSGAH
jgi:hypothetical protein